MYLGERLPLALLGLAAAVVLVPAPPWMVAVLGVAILASLVALDVALAPAASALGIRRRAPSVLQVHRPAEITLVVRNPLSRPLDIAIHDASLPSLNRVPRRHRVRIDARTTTDITSRVTPTRRGRFDLGPITCRTSGPLRLAGRQSRVATTTSVKIYPPLRGREEVELRVRRSRLLESGLRSSAIRGGGSNFDSLREYVPDDELRRVNWRATARSTRAMTNVYREERNQQVLLLLDASRAMAAQVEGVARLEHALDAAVAVAELASRVGDHVGAVAFGADVRAQLDPHGSRQQPHRIIDLLFGLEPALEAPNYGRAFGAVLRRHRRRSLLVLFTDVVERSVMEPLMEAMPILLARHMVVIAAIRDPVVEAMAQHRPTSSAEAYEKVAAAELLAWRAAAGGLLRRMGAVVLDLHPTELAGRVADEYLRIKATGRL
jgi:uncharacterized protein (DUF58 family)